MSERDTITVALPIPPASLSPNGGGRLRDRMRDKAAYRTFVAYAVWQVIGPDWQPWSGPVRVELIWFAPNRSHWPDGDNALSWCKAGWDGVIDAGLCLNDNQFRFQPVQCVVGPRGLTVTFRPEEQWDE